MRRTLLWWLAALSTAAYVAVAVLMLTTGDHGWREWLWLSLGPPSFLAAGLLLFIRRPGHPIGKLLLLTAIVGW